MTKTNKIFILSDGCCFESNPTVTINDEHLSDSSTAGAVCVGYTGINSINESGNTVSNGLEVPYMQFKTVSGSNGIEYKSDFNNLKTSLVDNGDGQYFIPLSGKYSYNSSLFYGSLSSTDELMFKTALFVKDRGYNPIILTDSRPLIYLLASENIDSITTTCRKNE